LIQESLLSDAFTGHITLDAILQIHFLTPVPGEIHSRTALAGGAESPMKYLNKNQRLQSENPGLKNFHLHFP
jgi:hypothetical protein